MSQVSPPIRVIVVEDELASRARLTSLVAAFPGLEVVAECGDGRAAVDEIVAHRPDLVLLDIQLPELTGFEVLDALPDECQPAVLFITAFDEFAIRAFDENAVDYVLKPWSPARLTRALGRAVERLATDRTARQSVQRMEALSKATQSAAGPIQRFAVRMAGKVYFVSPADVDWIDSADNYVRLHVGDRTHLVRGTLSELTTRLDPDRFVRIHRGALVRIDAIASIESHSPAKYRVTLRNGTRIQTSRTYARVIRALVRS